MRAATIQGSGTETVPSEGVEALFDYTQITEDVWKSCDFEAHDMAFRE
jgi:hypothetical protein